MVLQRPGISSLLNPPQPGQLPLYRIKRIAIGNAHPAGIGIDDCSRNNRSNGSEQGGGAAGMGGDVLDGLHFPDDAAPVRGIGEGIYGMGDKNGVGDGLDELDQVGDAAGLFEALGEVGSGKGVVDGLRGDGRAVMVEDLGDLPDGAVNIELKIIDIQPGDELSGVLRPGDEQADPDALLGSAGSGGGLRR